MKAKANFDKEDPGDGVLKASLRYLTDLLDEVYGKKTIILIDKYDAPLNKFLELLTSPAEKHKKKREQYKDELENTIEMFGALFSSAL